MYVYISHKGTYVYDVPTRKYISYCVHYIKYYNTNILVYNVTYTRISKIHCIFSPKIASHRAAIVKYIFNSQASIHFIIFPLLVHQRFIWILIQPDSVYYKMAPTFRQPAVCKQLLVVIQKLALPAIEDYRRCHDSENEHCVRALNFFTSIVYR